MPLKNSVGTQPASTATARYHASLHSSSLRSSFFFFPPPLFSPLPELSLRFVSEREEKYRSLEIGRVPLSIWGMKIVSTMTIVRHEFHRTIVNRNKIVFHKNEE